MMTGKAIKGMFLVALAAATLSCALTKGRKAEPYPRSIMPTVCYTEGIKAGLLGDAPYAAQMFRRAVALDSLHAPSYYELAGLYAETNPEAAIPYSARACRLDTANVWYRAQTGRLMIATRQYDKALDIYRDLARLAPNNPDNYRMLAALYSERKQPFTAISLLDSAEYKLGRIEELSDLKRQLLVDVGLYDKAIAESNAMIAEYPWNPGNYRILASLYARTNKDSLALSAYRQALAIDSTDIETLASLAAFYRKKGDVPNFFATTRKMIASDEMDLPAKLSLVNELKGNRALYQENFFLVRDLISLLLIKYPANYEVIDLYGQTIIASNGVEQAAEFYKSHLKDKDVPVGIFNTVLDMETYLKRPDSVAKYNALALLRFPNDPELYLRKGSSNLYLENYPTAMEAFKAAYKHAGTDSLRSATLVMIGEIYHRQGKDKKCFQSYDKALRLDPDNAVALNNYSYFLATTGPDGKDLDKSVEMAVKATTLSPGNATYLDTYAWALFKAGRLPEAKKVMQQAVSLDTTDSSELMIHYGDILYALKEYFMASIYWNKALERGHDKAQIEERLKLAEGK